MTKVLFVQTADAIKYRSMIELTSQTVREFCAKRGCDYLSFIGLKRGFHPWQAAYNRIVILMEVIESGFDGWVAYVDADGFIVNLHFDIHEYLDRNSKKALIIPRSRVNDDVYWEINDGIFFINLANKNARIIIESWYKEFMSIEDNDLKRCDDWVGIPNDQDLLQKVLKENMELEPYVVHDNVNIYGTGSKFIRQILRVDAPTYIQRLRMVEGLVFAVLARDGEESPGISHGELARRAFDEAFVTALYEVLLLRKADEVGFAENLKSLGRDGGNLAGMIKSFLKSAEFRDKFPKFCETYNLTHS